MELWSTASSPDALWSNRKSSGCSHSIIQHPQQGTWGQSCELQPCRDVQPPIGFTSSPALHKMKDRGTGLWRNPFLPVFSPIPAPRHKQRHAQAEGAHTSRSQQAEESQCRRGGKGKPLLLELGIGKAKGFVFHHQSTAMCEWNPGKESHPNPQLLPQKAPLSLPHPSSCSGRKGPTTSASPWSLGCAIAGPMGTTTDDSRILKASRSNGLLR